ncbi:MAG: hypothetical protein PVI57_21535 [Gemmatimonadota bacterium]|jgi:hypothetical protein
MISYGVYKIVHYFGVFLLVTALSATLGRAAAGPAGEAEGRPAADPWKRRLAMVHGVALFLVLLGGFGMLARLGVDHGAIFPGWIWAKLAIWVGLAALVSARRTRVWAARALVLVPLLAVLAAVVAYTKPF